MPQTTVVFYKDDEGAVPALDWVAKQPDKVKVKLQAALRRLRTEGYALRRPEADLLRDRIYELRVRLSRVNYRLLYFFYGDIAAVVAHGRTKEDQVEPNDIERAIRRRKEFLLNPAKHTHVE